MLSPAQVACERLFDAAEKSGVSILEHDKTEILDIADQTADPWLDKVVTAFAGALPAGGVKDVEWGPIKSALIASEPEIDTATNERIAALFDRIVAALQNASAHAPFPS